MAARAHKLWPLGYYLLLGAGGFAQETDRNKWLGVSAKVSLQFFFGCGKDDFNLRSYDKTGSYFSSLSTSELHFL